MQNETKKLDLRTVMVRNRHMSLANSKSMKCDIKEGCTEKDCILPRKTQHAAIACAARCVG